MLFKMFVGTIDQSLRKARACSTSGVRTKPGSQARSSRAWRQFVGLEDEDFAEQSNQLTESWCSADPLWSQNNIHFYPKSHIERKSTIL